MSKPPALSGRARTKLHRTSLVIGLLLLVVVALINSLPLLIARTGDGILTGLSATVFLTSLLWIPGLILVSVGIWGEISARRLNNADWSTAESLVAHANRLTAQPPATAYKSGAVIHLDPQRVLEVERHFDQKTAGEARGTLMHQFSMFGQSFGLGYSAGGHTSVAAGVHSAAINGMSDLHLALNSTTRSDLMGDALFAIFETRDSSGASDTLRVTAVSNGAVYEWIHGLVSETARRFGHDTHAGATIQSFANTIAGHFAPADVSYLSDRLHLALAQDKRGEAAPPIYVEGVPCGRGAIVATTARIGSADGLRIFPTALPAMWGNTVGQALAAATPPKEIAP